MKVETAVIDDVCAEPLTNGVTVSGDDLGSGTRLVNIVDLFKSHIINVATLGRAQIPGRQLARAKLQPGDIIFVRSSVKREGAAMCAMFPGAKEDVAFGCFNIRLRPDQRRVDPGYLTHFLRSPAGRERLLQRCNTATITNIGQDGLAAVAVPLPPLSEQERIAKLLNRAERLRRTRRFALQLTATFLQSAFVEMFGDPIANPRALETAPLDDLLASVEAGVNFPPIADNEPASDWRVLKVSAVTRGEFLADESKPISPTTKFDDSLIVRVGDLIMSRANTVELVGATARVRTLPPKVLLPDKLWRLKLPPKPRVDPDFLLHVLQHREMRHRIGIVATGTSGSMKNITQDAALALPIIIPPPAEQKRFATLVTRFERHRTRLREAERQADHLFQRLLADAFATAT